MLTGQDWDAIVIDSADPGLTRAPVLPLLADMADGPWLDDQVDRAARDRLLVAIPVFPAGAIERRSPVTDDALRTAPPIGEAPGWPCAR